MKQQITIVNTLRGTSIERLIDRETGRLSLRQLREFRLHLEVPPADEDAGIVGEYPLIQEPPECHGQAYRFVRRGECTKRESNVYMVPVIKPRAVAEQSRERTAAAG